MFRGGYRLSYDPAAYITYAKDANDSPNVISTTLTGADAAANPLPAVPTGDNVRTLLEPHLQTGIFDPRGFGQTTVSPDFGPDRVHQWSLGIQQEISHNAALEVRYVGNHGTRLFQTIDGNPYILGLANTYPELIPAGWKPCPASQAAIPELVGRVELHGRALWFKNAPTPVTRTTTDCRSSCARPLSGTNSPCRASIPSAKRPTIPAKSERLAPPDNLSQLSQSQVNFTGSGTRCSRGLISRTNSLLSVVEELPFFTNRGGVVGQVFGGWRAAAVYTLSSGQPYTAVQFSLSCNAGGDICASPASDTNPYDPAFNAEYALPDGSLRPFLGSNNAPVQSVGIFAQGYLRQRRLRNSLRESCHFPDHADQSQPVQQRFHRHEARWLQDGVVPDSTHPAQVVANDQVRFIANTPTAVAVFGTPFGNVGRNTLRDGHTNVLNFSAFKVTKLSENLSLQLHADFLNALNHPNYSSVDPFIDDAGRAVRSDRIRKSSPLRYFPPHDFVRRETIFLTRLKKQRNVSTASMSHLKSDGGSQVPCSEAATISVARRLFRLRALAAPAYELRSS